MTWQLLSALINVYGEKEQVGQKEINSGQFVEKKGLSKF